MRVSEILNRESIDIKFFTIDLTDKEIIEYSQDFFEVYNVDKPYLKFVSNIKRSVKNKVIESTEHNQIKPFIQMINSLDSLKKIKVGDQFAVLAFEIVFAWKEINGFGFTDTNEVAEIKLNSNNTIDYIKFTDGDRYPRLTPATYNNKPIVQTAYFDNKDKAKQALVSLLLKVPSDWDIDISNINGAEVNENFADGKVKGKSRPGRVKRAGASCKGSVTSLRQKAKQGGEKGKMYHWCANMKAGKQK